MDWGLSALIIGIGINRDQTPDRTRGIGRNFYGVKTLEQMIGIHLDLVTHLTGRRTRCGVVLTLSLIHI